MASASLVTTLDVYRPGDWFQMFRVHTMADPTKMIKVDPTIQVAVDPHIEGAMGQLGLVDDPAEATVAVSVDRPSPDPTPVHVDGVAGPVVREGAFGGSVDLLAPVVLAAHADPQSAGPALLVVDRAGVFHGCTIDQEKVNFGG